MKSLLTDAASDAELVLIERTFREIFDSERGAKLPIGWKFHIEFTRRWNLRVAAMRPAVSVVLENRTLADGHPKRLFGVKVFFPQRVQGREELKPVVLGTLRKCLEAGVKEGMSGCWFDGQRVSVPGAD